MAHALLKQMRLKFGAISADIEQKVAGSSVAELDVWLERVVSAKSAEDVIER